MSTTSTSATSIRTGKEVIAGVITGGLVIAGIVTGQAPLLSYAAKTAASLAGILVKDRWGEGLGKLAGDLANHLANRGVHHLRCHWLSQEGALNHDILKALDRAFQECVRQLERDWPCTPQYLRLKHRNGEAAKQSLAALQALREDGLAIFGRANQEWQTVLHEEDAVQWLQQDEEGARSLLAGRLRDYFYDHDAELLAFVEKRLADEWLVRFGEILKEPGEVGTRAWRAYQHLWQKTLAATIEQIQRENDEMQDDMVWLKERATRVEEQLAEQFDEHDRTALEAALAPVRMRLDHIKADTEQILASTLRIEAEVARLVGHLSPLASPTALSTESKPAAPRHNLPAQLTPFIGRVNEVAEITSLLQRPEVRLLTLTGSGGTGKTRLALQVASQLVPAFGDGIYVVWLASIRDVSIVLSTITQTLGVRNQGDQPLSNLLHSYLASRQMLLVLDNFEHLLAAGPLISNMLVAAPHLKVLVTSRAVLGLYGEHTYSVPPMALPEREAEHVPQAGLEDLLHYDAVQLFVERARSVQPDFEMTAELGPTVAEICWRLDGLPLALELAAAWMRILSPKAILSRLGNRLDLLVGGGANQPERHQTLRAMIGWSFDLLDLDKQRLFRRLGVFVGGFTLEAAGAVCKQDNESEVEVLDSVAELLGTSLLHMQENAQTEHRFGMLETIREYALEQLAAAGEEEGLLRHHAMYYLALAETMNLKLLGPEQDISLAQLEMEHDNLRAALAWSKADGSRAEVGLRLAGALWWFWEVRGFASEGREWLVTLLQMPGAERHTPARAKALTGAGNLSETLGEFVAARAFHEESLRLRRELGDKKGIADCLNNLAIVVSRQGDYATARKFHEESLALRRELGDRKGIADSLLNLANHARRQGDFLAAHGLYEESLALRREQGDKGGIALSLVSMASLANVQGNEEQAVALLNEGMALYREVGNKEGIAQSLICLGEIAYNQGEYERAAAQFEQCLELYRKMGAKRGIASSLNKLGSTALAKGDHARAIQLHEESLALHRELGDKHGVAASLNDLGEAARDQGDNERAVALYAESLAIYRELGSKDNIAWLLHNIGRATQAQGDGRRAKTLLSESLLLFQNLGDKRGIACSLAGVAATIALTCKPSSKTYERAVRLFAAADALLATGRIRMAPVNAAAFARNVAALRARMNETEYTVAWAAGHALPLDKAIADALPKRRRQRKKAVRAVTDSVRQAYPRKGI